MEIDIKKIQGQQKSKKKKSKEASVSFLQRDISFGSSKLSDKRKEKFYNQLGVLFSSGIDLGTALQIVIDDEKSDKIREHYQTILNDVIAGKAFSEAMHSTKQFTDYEYYSIKVGEESGRLQIVLKELTSYFELRVQQRRQVTGALSYPIMVMVVAIGAVLFMLNVVVPMFSGVFKRFGGELPPITQTVINLSNWFSNNLLMIILFLAGFIFLIMYVKRYPWFKKSSSLLILQIPYVGKLTRLLVHARFCHSVAFLTLAQVPLLDVLTMVKNMISFYPMKDAIDNVKTYIEKGKHMYEGMERSKLFDRQLVSLTKVGEEVNQVGQLYSRLYEQYTNDIKHTTSVIGNMLEPLMIVFVGVLVMVILIAMYLPLFQLSTTVF